MLLLFINADIESSNQMCFWNPQFNMHFAIRLNKLSFNKLIGEHTHLISSSDLDIFGKIRFKNGNISFVLEQWIISDYEN
jgi:hypothetical protein